MKVKHLFENELMPPKVIGYALGKFFGEVVNLIVQSFPLDDDLIEGITLDVNLFDTMNASAVLCVSYTNSYYKPPAHVKKDILARAKVNSLNEFDPLIRQSRETQFEYIIEVRFQHMDSLDLDAVDMMQETFNKTVGERPSFLEVQF